MNEEPPLKPYIELPRMASASSQMLRESLDSFIKEDVVLARKVMASDDEVDDMNEELFRELLTYMLDNPRNISRATRPDVHLEILRENRRPCDEHRGGRPLHGRRPKPETRTRVVSFITV